MNIVTIDFETYYDKEFSLSKLTTEEYVRDARFQVIGVGVKVNHHAAKWYTGDDVRKVLNPSALKNVAILCHNTAFDGAILAWHYGVKPMLWLDTLSMARPFHGLTAGGSLSALAQHYALGTKGDEVVNALGKRLEDFSPEELARYGRYCTNDVELTHALFRKLSQKFPASEVRLVDIAIRMYTQPTLLVDKDKLSTHLDEIVERKERMLGELGLEASDLQSNDRLAAILQALDVEPPRAKSKTTGEMTYSFSKTNSEFLALVDHDDARVGAIVSARLGVRSTLEEKRTNRLLGVAQRGPLPVMLNYYGAHTGRFSGGDKMNLQNLPRGGTLRKSLCAPDGYTLVAADSSQIEARMLAWLAGQTDLVNAFKDGRDVYCEFASVLYRRPITKADTTERFVGKTCILGLGYGMGAERFRAQMALGVGGNKVVFSDTEASAVVHTYRSTYHRIEMFWNRCKQSLYAMANGPDRLPLSDTLPSLLTSMECVRLPNGLAINYPMLTQDPTGATSGWCYAGDARTYRAAKAAEAARSPLPYDRFTRLYGGKVTENIVQALARIVVSDQMIAASKRWHIAMQVHDEIVLCVPDAHVEEAIADLSSIMRTPPAWANGLPVACSVAHGKTYGDCK